MSFPLWMPRMRRASLVRLRCCWQPAYRKRTVHASQSTPSSDASSSSTSSSSSYSSSQSGLTQTELAEFVLPEAPTPSASASSGGGGGGQYAAGERHSVLHNWTFEAGGGFNAPISNSVTYGGQFTVGAGLKFNKYLSTLIEYQFLDSKLPGNLIAEAGAKGGYAHIWSFTIDPVIDLMPKATNDVYVTGGGGFYRKVTSFTDPEETEYCYYFCEVGTDKRSGWPLLVQSGRDQHRRGLPAPGGRHVRRQQYGAVCRSALSGRFHPGGNGKPNGLGVTSVAANTQIIPVSVGVRF